MSGHIIEFLRKKDYVLVEELGRGACGKTVVLRDDTINETFACKKFAPYDSVLRPVLFDNFVREIKILFRLNHKNIVRVFNYYLYPDKFTGYILMELIKGSNIEEYLAKYPEYIDRIFRETVVGFCHLEENEILHRDIRPTNILVTHDGITKIIDFGFGKNVPDVEDFDKSITLNWWCDVPMEFQNRIYEYKTEVYFVGKLFEKIITDNEIEQFSYKGLIDQMVKRDPSERISSFQRVNSEIKSEKSSDIAFSDDELNTYRRLAHSISGVISSIACSADYHSDIAANLEELYINVQLEEWIPANSIFANCFIDGDYRYDIQENVSVEVIYKFIQLLRHCSRDKKNILVRNIRSRLDGIYRHDEEIPF